MEEITYDYRTNRSLGHHDRCKQFLIVVVLLQHGAQQGLGAVSGSADTFYGSGKASASDRIFARLTSIVGVVFVIIAIVLNLIH